MKHFKVSIKQTSIQNHGVTIGANRNFRLVLVQLQVDAVLRRGRQHGVSRLEVDHRRFPHFANPIERDHDPAAASFLDFTRKQIFCLLGIIISCLIALFINYKSTNSVTKLVLPGFLV
jgi:hypothetical protein